MTKLRLATYVVGGALVAAGTFIPGAQALLAAGFGLVGWATQWPQAPKAPKEKE